MNALQTFLHDAADRVEAFLGVLPPEVQADAVKLAGDMRSNAEVAADAEVTRLAPAFAPEVIPLINKAMDDAIAALQNEASGKVAALQDAKAVVAAAAVPK